MLKRVDAVTQDRSPQKVPFRAKGPLRLDDRAGALHLLGMARHVEGVVALRDRLSYPTDVEQLPPVPAPA